MDSTSTTQQVLAQQPQVDTLTIAATIATAKGSLPLAAERLHTTPQALIAQLANDPNAYDLLTRAFRTVALLDTFTAVETLTSLVLVDAADENTGPTDRIKALSATATLFGELTRATPTTTLAMGNVNVYDKVMAMLPPEARDAVKALAAPQQGREVDTIDQPAGDPNPIPGGYAHAPQDFLVRSGRPRVRTPRDEDDDIV